MRLVDPVRSVVFVNFLLLFSPAITDHKSDVDFVIFSSVFVLLFLLQHHFEVLVLRSYGSLSSLTVLWNCLGADAGFYGSCGLQSSLVALVEALINRSRSGSAEEIDKIAWREQVVSGP